MAEKKNIKKDDSTHIAHKERNIAYHMDWEFRQEAAIYLNGSRPVEPNIRPIGSMLRKWMLRQGQIEFLTHADKKRHGAPTNPYLYDACALILAFADVINAATTFIKSEPTGNDAQDEITHLRLYTEYILYPARVLEALIKQMLYVTTFPEANYKKAPLGDLLTTECSGCRSSEEKRHKISLLGSLAHRYGFCGAYEKCLHSKMEIVRKRRNLEAAHSDVVKFIGRPARRTRQVFAGQRDRIGSEFLHMLKHIEDIEKNMISEIRVLIRDATN
jgi:hypothetical protein